VAKGIEKGQELYGAYGDAWQATLGGVPPWSRIGKAIKAASALGYAPEALYAAWCRYLRSEGKWSSPEKFAATVGLWAQPEAVQIKHGPLVDEWGTLTIEGDILTRPR
jgi:hypothetical protein